MVSSYAWLRSIDKRPEERAASDVKIIAQKLRRFPPFDRFGEELLSELSNVGYFEELEPGIVLFQESHISCNWFVLLSGTVDVVVQPKTKHRSEAVRVYTLTAGCSFGDEALKNELHSCSAVVRSKAQLIRVERSDFRPLWQRFSEEIGPTLVPLKTVVESFLANFVSVHRLTEQRDSAKQPLAASTRFRTSADESNYCAQYQAMASDLADKQRATPDSLINGLERLSPNASVIESCSGADMEPTNFIRKINQRLPKKLKVRISDKDLLNNQSTDIDLDVASQSVNPDLSLRSAVPPTEVDASRREIPSTAASTPVSKSADEFPQRNAGSSVIELSGRASSESVSVWAGRILRSVMLLRTPSVIRDRKFHLIVYKRCMIGSEMVDWLLIETKKIVASRTQAVGMWQALLEEGVLVHVSHEHPFNDKYLFYRWAEDDGTPGQVVKVPDVDEQRSAEQEFNGAITRLMHIGPDALFRMILGKAPRDRTPEELDVVFEELLNIKALSHLSTMVKRELASVMMFEQHQNAGTVLFLQGDEGKSWYIIVKGSVNVLIHGKGAVCTLHEGDDFGKLALVNDAPRAATIILNENNCQFLRVDKHDFNRILRDVEANTVRLKEHGFDVLVLEKIPIRVSQSANIPKSAAPHRYSVMAGTPEKMLEYLLETRIDCEKDDSVPDTFMDDFIYTHLAFGMPTNVLCNALSLYYHQARSPPPNEATSSTDTPLTQQNDQTLTNRRRVVLFLQHWLSVANYTFFQDPAGGAFIEEIFSAILEHGRQQTGLGQCLPVMESLMALRERAMRLQARRPAVILEYGVPKEMPDPPSPVAPFDVCVFKVYGPEGAYVTLKARVDKSSAQIKQMAAQKLALGNGDDVDLVEVKSSGEKIVYPPAEISVPSVLSLNGQLFVAFKDQTDSVSPLAEQAGPVESVHSATLELLGSAELAYQLLLNHWRLFANTHEYEYLYQTIGRDRFAGRVPTNLDLLTRRFNEVQFWVITEIVLCSNVSKRSNLLKKFIKIAAQAKAHQDLLTFFAVVLGLSNVAVGRLSLTWEKLPTKFRKCFLEFENLLDPSRNHRAYRLLMSKLKPPIIPFVPLILKDLTFAHEGNKTYYDGLVNFEKMHMIAQTLRLIRYCKSEDLVVDPSAVKNSQEAQQLVNFRIIDDQRRLLALSQKLEARKEQN